MKHVVFVFYFLPFIFIANTPPDTVDYWHVYYNNGKLNELNFHNETKKIVLSDTSIHTTDSLTIKYFSDAPCSSCLTTISVEDDKNHPVTMGQGKGTNNPISFSLQDIKDFSERSGIKYFELWYYEEGNPKKGRKVFLCRIKLE